MVDREPHAGHPTSWTGSGFARMQEGGWVEFHVSDVPFSMEYDVIIRYEPQVSPLIGVLHLQKWHAGLSVQ